VIALLLAALLAQDLPADPLIDASTVVPGLIVELRYATENNFLHQRIYPPDARCILRTSVAQRLAAAAKTLAADGLRLVAWDCYRPPSAQEAMWKLYPHPGFVADPKTGSNHSRGAAVDVSLASMDGKPVEVPTDFDAFTPQAHLGAQVGAAAARHRAQLIHAMLGAGFHTILKEWWHYNAPHAQDFTIVEASLSPAPKRPWP
jgi:D-alanyl-D-alanine dipeptidase